MWTIEEALALIRHIQPLIQPMGFHVCLAGGVLNKGTSDKDVDLVFVPLTNAVRPALGELCAWLDATWGLARDNLTDKEPCIALRYQASYVPSDGKRVDVFVI